MMKTMMTTTVMNKDNGRGEGEWRGVEHYATIKQRITTRTMMIGSSSGNSDFPPCMVHASQSDNSLDRDDDAASFISECHEDAAAGEWAAALVKVADQSMDMEGVAHFFGRDRSVSESSSDGSPMASSSALSKSPVGFWYVRPGSSSLPECASDNDNNEPISWAPSLESTGLTHPVEGPSSFD